MEIARARVVPGFVSDNGEDRSPIRHHFLYAGNVAVHVVIDMGVVYENMSRWRRKESGAGA